MHQKGSLTRDPTRPAKIALNLTRDATRHDPIRGWTRSVSIYELEAWAQCAPLPTPLQSVSIFDILRNKKSSFFVVSVHVQLS